MRGSLKPNIKQTPKSQVTEGEKAQHTIRTLTQPIHKRAARQRALFLGTVSRDN